MDSNGVVDTVETHGSVEETTSPDDDVSVCSELSSVQHRIYLLKHKIGRGRIADSSTSILGATVLNSTQCAAQVEFLVNNKLQARSFLAWCGAYKAISFRKSTLLTNAFRVLHLNRIHRSDGHGDYIIRGSCMDESCGGVGELGSMISELTYGYGEEQDDEGIFPFDTPTSERSEQDGFNLHTQHHAFQRRVALRKDENVSTPRASVLHRHRVYNKVYGDKGILDNIIYSVLYFALRMIFVLNTLCVCGNFVEQRMTNVLFRRICTRIYRNLQTQVL